MTACSLRRKRMYSTYSYRKRGCRQGEDERLARREGTFVRGALGGGRKQGTVVIRGEWMNMLLVPMVSGMN